MISLRCLPHDSVELSLHEVGDLDVVSQLPWVNARVARVVQTRLGIQLRLGPYVGRLVIPDRVVIDVEEPFPGTVATCLELSTAGRRTAPQKTPPSRIAVSPWATIAVYFERALTEYVSKGIERIYIPRSIITSRPRGRVDLTKTVLQLASRGRNQHVLCTVRPLTDDTPLNRAIAAGAGRAEQLLLREGATAVLSSLRRSMMALGGIRRDIPPDFRTARMYLDRQRLDHAEVLALAEILVAGVPTLPHSERHDPTYALTAWLNVEQMFEEAVLEVVREAAVTVGAQVRRGQGDGIRLFSQLTGDPQAFVKEANPDVVITLGDRTWLMDAKYRRHEGQFTEDELYQLIAHAGAYRAAAAALVAPARHGEVPGYRWLGRDKGGTAYYVVTVDPSSSERMKTPISAWLFGHVTPQ